MLYPLLIIKQVVYWYKIQIAGIHVHTHHACTELLIKVFLIFVNEGTTPEFYTLILTFTMATVYRKPSTSQTGSWPCHSTNTETTSFQAQVTKAFWVVSELYSICSWMSTFCKQRELYINNSCFEFFGGTISKIYLYYSKFQVICTRLVLRAGDITLWMCHSRRE